MIKYAAFEQIDDDDGAVTSLAVIPSEHYDRCIASGAKLICEFEESDHNRAMQRYYDIFGYGTYKPMD